MRITNKRRFISVITILVLIILFIIMLTSKTYSSSEYETRTIYISYGDTLWSIASNEQENNKYYIGKSLNEIIYDIKSKNSLNDSYIYAGQELEIPTL